MGSYGIILDIIGKSKGSSIWIFTKLETELAKNKFSIKTYLHINENKDSTQGILIAFGQGTSNSLYFYVWFNAR